MSKNFGVQLSLVWLNLVVPQIEDLGQIHKETSKERPLHQLEQVTLSAELLGTFMEVCCITISMGAIMEVCCITISMTLSHFMS